MTKKNLSLVLASALVALTALGSGCKQTLPAGMAEVATKDLGIPVFLWAMDDDVCANRQIKALFNEYGSWNSSGRFALTKKFKDNYKAVVVLATKDLGDTTGVLKSVRLTDGRNHVVSTKILVDTRVNEGHRMAGTDIDKGDAANIEGKVLSLRPYRSTDKSVKSLYTTYDATAYGKLGTTTEVGALTIEDAVTQGSVYLLPQGYADADLCGKLAGMADLF